jgi:NPCBM/NEW2 domain/Protein of unknown function (DUF1583)
MRALALLLVALLGSDDPTDYSRSLGSKALDQPTLDAEGYGEKKVFTREVDGLRIILPPGDPETGWKTPPQLRFGGDFTISANFVIKKLPKPVQEDGAAIGLAIAFQDPNQPDVTLVRVLEPNGSDVYLSIEKPGGNPMQMQVQMQMNMRMMMMGQQPGGKPPKPPRHTFPAAGDTVRMELVREGQTIRYQVVDAKSTQPRYLGQVELGPNDVMAVKLFATNRNGAEAVNVLLRDLTIRADRINGLGTAVRTVYDEVVYADPTRIEKGLLVVGGPPAPPKLAPGTLPADVFAPVEGAAASGTPGSAPAAAAVAAAPVAAVATPAPAQPMMVVLAPAGGGVVRVARAATAAATVAPGSAPLIVGEPGGAGGPQAPVSQTPKARIPLDEVDSIRFERAPALAARFVGQLNLDFTMPGLSAPKDETPPKAEAKPSGAPKAEANKAETKKAGEAPKAEEKKKEAAPKAEEKKKEAPPKAEEKKKEAAPKAEEKKTDGSDDVLAPPPGTTIAKFPKVEPRKNGIRDLCLSLFGLREAKIKQVTVNCQTDKGPTSWRLDTTDSQDWPLVIRRPGNDISADIFLEPPPGDCHQKNFTIMIQYEDGQAGNATAMVQDHHTDPKLAVDPKTLAVPLVDAWLYLTGDEKLFGKLESIGQETLRLTTPWQDHLEVPLARVIGVHLGMLDRKESAASFAKRLKTRGSEDLLLAQTKNAEVIAIPGILEGVDNDKLQFRYQDRTRTMPLRQVEGLIMGSRPESPRTDGLHPTFTLPHGVVVSGKWQDLDSSVWTVESAWGQALKLPAADIQGVRFAGGKMTYLSDLTPSKVEEAPYFGHRLPWRRDVSLVGEPLRMKGRTYGRGLAVHSRCALTYDLGGRYATFEALVGFDDATKGRGRVDCRVFADDKEIYSNPDLSAAGAPVPLKLPVTGTDQLRLLVDFGRGQDTGDRVIWANARLYRPSPKTAASREPAGDSDQAVKRR